MPVITEDRLARSRYSLACEKLVLCSVTLIGIAHTIRKHHGAYVDRHLERDNFLHLSMRSHPRHCYDDGVGENERATSDYGHCHAKSAQPDPMIVSNIG